jgi:hypothetical protein
MAQGEGLNGPEGSSPEVSSTGGLPSDFYERPRTQETGPEPVVTRAAPVASRRVVPATPPRERTGRRSIIPIVGAVLLGNVLLFLGGALAGWAWARKEAAAMLSAAIPFPGTGVAPDVARSVESKASKDEVGHLKNEVGSLEAEIRGLKAEVQTLASEATRLQKRIDTPPKSTPTTTATLPDLKPIQTRLDRLAEANKSLAGLPGEVHAFGERFREVDAKLEQLRTELAKLPKQLKESVAPPAESASESSKPVVKEPSPADEARGRGVALFKEGKFSEARDLFLRLTLESPDDARVWYLAALSNGFATGDWGNESTRLVMRGVERERAGTPNRAAIDTALNDLNQEQGKEWVRSWRTRATPR